MGLNTPKPRPVNGGEPTSRSKHEKDAQQYQQNVPTPPPSALQAISTNQSLYYLSSNQYTALGKWAAAITTVFCQEELDPQQILASSIANILEAVQASPATCAYTLAVFRRLWRTGDNLHKELDKMIEEGRLIPVISDQHPTEGLILGTFHWALWVATVALTDYANCFSWFDWLEVDKSQGWRLQIATLADLNYNILLPSDEWRHRLNLLSSASWPLQGYQEYRFIWMALKTEIERATAAF